MNKELTFEELSDSILRLVSRGKSYYGSITFKYQNGIIKNIIADDSFNIEYLKEKKIILKDMFIKNGSPNLQDKESSKIISEVKVDTTGEIIKESKIEKKDADTEK